MGAFHDERQIYQFPIQRPQQFRHVRDGDSGLLRGGHWHPSQLETNEASEPEQLNCHFHFDDSVGGLSVQSERSR